MQGYGKPSERSLGQVLACIAPLPSQAAQPQQHNHSPAAAMHADSSRLNRVERQ